MTIQRSTVLVVDDDPTIRFLAEQFLGKAGFSVSGVENGKQALSAVDGSPPDLVMLDVMMPEMDGFTTCETLRKLPAGKNIPVLMATGLDDLQSIRRAYEVGATDFITKPIQWVILEHRVRYLLRSAQAMDNLRKSEAKNRALLNAIPDLMFRLGRDGTVLEFKRSKPFDPLLPGNALQQKKVTDILPEDFAGRLLKHAEKTLRTDRAGIFEHRLRINGGLLSVESRVVVSGKDEVLVIIRDDTQRKSAEEELRQAHENLERRVEERTRELTETNAKLEEEIRQRRQVEADLRETNKDLKDTQIQLIQSAKLASIGELAAGVVHELNQPLMVIRGYAQALLSPSMQREEQTNGLKLIEKNTGRMTNIINHLRVFSRQSQSDFKAVEINRVIEDAFLMIGEQLRLRDIKLVKSLADDLPPVWGDANKLEQVFLNLITNARDAVDQRREKDAKNPGGGNRRDGKLEIVTRVSPDRRETVEILFTDTGSGIPHELKDKIFDPFFTTKEVGKGTGLGLSISYGIIKEHNADIDVAATGPNGSTFRILLPACRPKASV